MLTAGCREQATLMSAADRHWNCWIEFENEDFRIIRAPSSRFTDVGHVHFGRMLSVKLRISRVNDMAN